MNKPLVADTSFLVNFFNGSKSARQILGNTQVWISVITEIELLSSPTLTIEKRKIVKEFLSQIQVLELIKPIREKAIQLRLNKSFGLADSIIAASAWHLRFPLFTYDYDFKKVDDLLNVIILDSKK